MRAKPLPRAAYRSHVLSCSPILPVPSCRRLTYQSHWRKGGETVSVLRISANLFGPSSHLQMFTKSWQRLRMVNFSLPYLREASTRKCTRSKRNTSPNWGYSDHPGRADAQSRHPLQCSCERANTMLHRTAQERYEKLKKVFTRLMDRFSRDDLDDFIQTANSLPDWIKGDGTLSREQK